MEVLQRDLRDEGKKKGIKVKLKAPNIVTLLFMLTILAATLTWIIPAGQFDKITEGTITKAIPGSFHFVEQNPQGIWDIFQAIAKGYKDSASLIFMILFIGATIYMAEKSGSIDLCFSKLVDKVQGKEWLAIFVVMAFMTIGGAAGVFGNATLALIPIGIILSEALGYDKFLGFAIIFFGSFSGFAVGWANVTTIGIAQEIAQIPIFSGFAVRLIFHIVNFSICYAFVLRYAKKVKKNYKYSLNHENGFTKEDIMGIKKQGDDVIKSNNITWKHITTLILLALTVILLVVGSLKYNWGVDQYSAAFLMLAVSIGIIHGYGMNGISEEFIKGCKTMVFAGLIVGIARAITIVMTDGQILDTIAYYLSLPINKVGSIFGANLMLLSNIILNFFISSGPGQAATVMPIMIPLADLTGITRQVAVQAYQFGDGITNSIVPTIGTLMGGLAFAKVSYSKYMKWVLPLITTQILLAFVAITVLQYFNWTGL